MPLRRRDVMRVSVGALVALTVPARAQQLLVMQQDATLDEVIVAFTDGAPIAEGSMSLSLPDVAEDGYRVPVAIEAPQAEEAVLIAPGNPVVPVLKIRFGPLAGSQKLSTRMRLAQTQDVLALARMPGGTVAQDTQPVSVIVGGCA
ncbi:thiosulfate oxidation carrier protein SoxY [Ruegeria sp. 2205SS24-7]|uniref:thiosulfate oxidation carrier protein SoxY n=1 Tax=Ruegeria discodermiae TaxID=3064389 RepID=UPI0027413415|nr:thiosulfate oxidation carrier protein SoxY [Ruegeria sp. 2205SS24-7]MDP5217019.1 thiosulfate oxidation carrier protein SoxY [Ruegeria sp. 2205SS24-7]